MIAAARIEEDGPIELPNRIVNLSTLERQIRRFIDKLGGPRSMSLPPCDKDTRRKVHELANAFNLKSVSSGHGTNRYTTLTKTSRTGTNINEKKVNRILREDDGDWVAPGKKGKTKATSLAKHKEGEEVGKVGSSRDGLAREISLLIENVSGCTEDWRRQLRVQVACRYGMGGRRTYRVVWRVGCTAGGEDEEDEVRSWSHDF